MTQQMEMKGAAKRIKMEQVRAKWLVSFPNHLNQQVKCS
jgi:hypothetical protein